MEQNIIILSVVSIGIIIFLFWTIIIFDRMEIKDLEYKVFKDPSYKSKDEQSK